MATESLSIEQARRVALRAQGLRGARVTKGGVAAMARRLGAVQLDTISVLARSHELVAYAATGGGGTEAGGTGLLGPEERDVRVLVACRMRAAIGGLARVHVQAPSSDAPRASGGTSWLNGTRRCSEVLARLRGGRTADGQRAGWRQEGRPVVGLVGDQDRERSGCWTSASSSAVSGAASPASTTWQRGRSRLRSWRRTGATRNVPQGWWRQRGAPWAWRRRRIWPFTTGCRGRSCAGCWTRPG